MWGSLLIICGLVGATVSGILIGKTKLYKEIGIGNLFFTILALICFIEVLHALVIHYVSYYH